MKIETVHSSRLMSNPLFPAPRSSQTAFSGGFSKKQIPVSQFSVFQNHPHSAFPMNIRNSIAIFAMIGALPIAFTNANAQTVLIDWSSAASVTNPGLDGNYWNSNGTIGLKENLISSANIATPWDVNVAFGAYGTGYGGTGISGPSGPPPFDEPNAVVDGIFAARDNYFATITFSDLAPDTGYRFSAIGGRATFGDDGIIAVTTGTGSGGTLLNDGTVLDFTVTSDASGVIAFTFSEDLEAVYDPDGATFNALSITQIPNTPPTLKVAQSAGGLEFEWNSRSGMRYDLLSNTDFITNPETWASYDDGSTVYENIPASGTGINTLSAVAKSGPARFFVLREEKVPPLLSEDFEAGNGGFTVVDKTAGETGANWAYGTPDSSGPGGTVGIGNEGSANCWGTNLGAYAGGSGDPGFYTDPTDTCLRSPVIDLTGVPAAVLSFAQAIDLDPGGSAKVNIIDANTATVIAEDIVTTFDDNSVKADWKTVGPVTIPTAALGRKVRIEWRLSGTGGASKDFMGWYIDDVMVAPAAP